SFAPISFEATKDSLKRFGEELQTKTPKRMKEDKDDEAKDDEPTKKFRKRRKQIARKGMHTSVDKNVSEDSDKVDEQKETNTGTETPLNPVPVAMKIPSVATYKIIKQGEKGSISRDDLTELYRIVMNRYGLDGPEDKKYPFPAEVKAYSNSVDGLTMDIPPSGGQRTDLLSELMAKLLLSRFEDLKTYYFEDRSLRQSSKAQGEALKELEVHE
ncbi:hypothetical protein Tco_1319926, partial [Tanacetum coccineum]